KTRKSPVARFSNVHLQLLSFAIRPVHTAAQSTPGINAASHQLDRIPSIRIGYFHRCPGKRGAELLPLRRRSGPAFHAAKAVIKISVRPILPAHFDGAADGF